MSHLSKGASDLKILYIINLIVFKNTISVKKTQYLKYTKLFLHQLGEQSDLILKCIVRFEVKT